MSAIYQLGGSRFNVCANGTNDTAQIELIPATVGDDLLVFCLPTCSLVRAWRLDAD